MLICSSLQVIASGQGYPAYNLIYNEDFTAPTYSQLSTFNTADALSGQRWYPTSKDAQLYSYGQWNSYSPSQSSASLNLNQGGATFSAGGNQPPPATMCDSGRVSSFTGVSLSDEPTEHRLLSGFREQLLALASPPEPRSSPPGIARIFPYIFVGPSSMASPFPATGSFFWETAVQFVNHIGIDGCGIHVRFWSDCTPTGVNNPPMVTANTPWATAPYPNILTIWSDTSLGVRVQLLNGAAHGVGLNTALAMHVYRIECVQSGSTYTYKAKIDGVTVDTNTSTVRPNCFWMGNPVYNWWTQGPDWQTMVVDYVRVGTLT